MCIEKTNLEIKGVGNITGKLSNGMEIILNNALYVSNLNVQLIFVIKIESANYAIFFKNENAFFEKGRKLLLFQ